MPGKSKSSISEETVYDTSDIRKNLKILLDGEPHIVVDFQFVKPGKGQAFTRTRLKSLITGYVIDRTFRSGDKLKPADLEEHDMQFLYCDGEMYHFMNTETYEQIAVAADHLGNDRNFLAENLNVMVLMFQGNPIGVTLPYFVELEITDTTPGVKGDTVSGATKSAEVSTGAQLQVPLFINQGDWIKVDTRTGEYVERVKK